MTPIYLASINPHSYYRPAIYCFEDKLKECNRKKAPLLVPANTVSTHRYYKNNFHSDEYIVFPKNTVNIEGEIYLTHEEEAVYINITSKEQYRCVGLEMKSLFKRVWIPISVWFFENLLIDQEFAEFKRYSIFRNIDKDYVVTGKFKIENGFLELDN